MGATTTTTSPPSSAKIGSGIDRPGLAIDQDAYACDAQHRVSVDVLNDACGNSAAAARNLCLDGATVGATVGGTAAAAGTLPLCGDGGQDFRFFRG